MTSQTNPLSHRFDLNQINDPLYVQDAFNMAACHANSVLNLLSIQFESKARVSDETIEEGLDAVRVMVKDMQAIIGAHFDAAKAGKEAAQ
jgi:hypothetical protein